MKLDNNQGRINGLLREPVKDRVSRISILRPGKPPTSIPPRRFLFPFPYSLLTHGRWPDHQLRRITIYHDKLCPVHRGYIAMSGRLAQVSLLKHGYHEPPCAGCSLFPVPYSLLLRCMQRIIPPGRTMVLSRAKEKRTKGEENIGTPLPPIRKPSFLRAGYQGKCNKINSLIDIPVYSSVNRNPGKPSIFDQETSPFLPVLREKRPRLEQF